LILANAARPEQFVASTDHAMTRHPQQLSFNQRLNLIEAQRRAGETQPATRQLAVGRAVMRFVAVMPVWVVVVKGAAMAFLGDATYLHRVAELYEAGGIGRHMANILAPDPLSFGLAGLLAGLPGLS